MVNKKQSSPKKGNKACLLKRSLAFILSCAIAAPLLVPENTQKRVEKTVHAATENVTYGDVNSDGKISILDMIALKSYITEKNTKGFSVKAADLDGDGTVSARDAVELSMFLLNQTGSFSYEMNIDTDGDGLCDYVEKEILGTNYLKADTDGDELDDYSEVYLCDTDPLSADTGKTGVKDAAKDSDGDMLTNAEEIKLGTSPTLIDTDEDGLSDYDEVNEYKTDPLKQDTDGDGISDYGEIRIGLNPKSDKSDGSGNDKERLISQSLDADNKKLSQINTEDNPYQLSLLTDATGFIEETMDIRVSDYSAFLMEDEIYGSIVDIECCDGYKISKMKLNFKLKSVSDPKDYIIFRYSDDDGVLLPTNTQYDGANLYITDCDPGTYCISNVAEMAKYYEDETVAESSLDLMTAKAAQSTVKALYEIQISSDCTVKSWSQIENTMKNVSQKLEKAAKPFNFTLVFTAFGYSVSIGCSSSDEIKSICDTATAYFNDTSITSSNDAYQVYTKNRSQGLPVWKDLSSASTGFSDSGYYSSGNVIISFNGTGSAVRKYLPVSSGGFYICAASSRIAQYTKMYSNMLANISGSTVDEKLYQILVYEDTISARYPVRMSLFGRKLLSGLLSSGSTTDTDGDNKSDYSEIKGTYSLSKLVKSSEDTMVFISRINLKTGGSFTADDIKVTTLKSDPTRIDSDEDGIPDSEDKRPKKADYRKVDDKLLDDSKIFEEGYVRPSDKSLSDGALLSSNAGDKANAYINYRNSKYAKDRNSYPSRYEITPVANSDYRITVDTALNDNCDVYVFEKGFLVDTVSVESTITDEKEKYVRDETNNVKHNNYQYILKAGKTYRIDVVVCSCDNRRDSYDVKVEQDNWVYAPDGGVALNKEANFSAVYFKDDALRVIMDDTKEHWADDKKRDSFSKSLASNLGYFLYDETRGRRFLYIAKENEYEFASDISTLSTYAGVIIQFWPGYDGKFISGLVTITGGVTTYIANYPVGRLKFQDTIKEAVDSFDYKDISMVLYRYDKIVKVHEQFECEKWNGDYIYRYKRLNINNIIFDIEKDYRLDFLYL